MCHVNNLTNDQRIEFERWPQRWQMEFEKRTGNITYPMLTAKTRDVYEDIAKEMGKSSERIAETVSA